MSSVFIIAANTFREIIRDRILYGLIVFAVLLFFLSLVLGDLSWVEQARISANFGFAGMHLSAVVLAIFVGSTLVSKEIEKQTVLTLLAKPLTRGQFILGKFLGHSMVIIVVLLGLAMLLALILASLDMNFSLIACIATIGIFFEAIVLLSITIFFGVLSKPMLAVTFVVGTFIIGHAVDSLPFFIEKSQSAAFKAFGKILEYLVPNLEKFNWRNLVVYQESVSLQDFASASLYALAWILIFLSLANLVFSRRDFV